MRIWRRDRSPASGSTHSAPQTRTERTVVVCLAADVPVADLALQAVAAVNNRRVATAGLVPYFAARPRRSRKLLDCAQQRTCGGPIRLLDLDAMRRSAVADADLEWRLWQHVVAGTKPANPWWWYQDKHLADPDRYRYERALRDYASQARILAMQAYNAVPHRPCPLPPAHLEAFQAGYRTYLNLAWLAAVPADGVAFGDIGWLASRSERLPDRLDYLGEANAALDGLDRDANLVAVAAEQ